MAATSLDYVSLTGSKHLLDEVVYNKNLIYPWDGADLEKNKKIIEEYLNFRHINAQKKIQNGWHFGILCYTMCIVRSKKMRKIRTAKALFVKDSPYKPRIIRNKKTYCRKLKHKASK